MRPLSLMRQFLTEQSDLSDHFGDYIFEGHIPSVMDDGNPYDGVHPALLMEPGGGLNRQNIVGGTPWIDFMIFGGGTQGQHGTVWLPLDVENAWNLLEERMRKCKGLSYPEGRLHSASLITGFQMPGEHPDLKVPVGTATYAVLMSAA